MALDDFLSGSSDSADSGNDGNVEDEDDSSEEYTNTGNAQQFIEKPDYVNPAENHEPTTEYDEEYFKECYRCNNKSVLIPQLSPLGNVWFCTNSDCFSSVSSQLQRVAGKEEFTQQIEVQTIQKLINQEDFNPNKMALDDFSSDDSSSSSSSSSDDEEDTDDLLDGVEFEDEPDTESIVDEVTGSSSDTSSSSDTDIDDLEPDTDKTFYGTGNADLGVEPMERKGAMSNYSTGELMNSADGTIESDRDDIKFHSPNFPVITRDKRYNPGDHYALKYTGDLHTVRWHNRVVSCMSCTQTELGEMNKEVVMFAVGSPSKKIAMSRLHDSIGEDIDGDTEVYLSFFGDTMFMRDLAQANMEYREGDMLNIDDIGSHLLNRNMLRVGLDEPSPIDGGE